MINQQASKTVILTGATGFIGSYLLRDLVRAGDTVICLARSQKEKFAQERVWQALATHERLPAVFFDQEELHQLFFGESIESGRVRVVEADLRLLGEEVKRGETPEVNRLEGELRQTLSALGVKQVDSAIFAAAALGMREEERSNAELVNVFASQGLTEVLQRLTVPSFDGSNSISIGQIDVIGTAYMWGKGEPQAAALFEAELQAWKEAGLIPNPYVETKHRQARRILEFGWTTGIPVNFHLPSIVAGELSRTGFGLNAFINFAQRKRIIEGLQRALVPLGLPIPFPGDPKATIDIVDVEDVTGRIIRELHRPSRSREGRLIYHTHPQPAELGELMSQVLAHFGYRESFMDGVSFIPAETIGELLEELGKSVPVVGSQCRRLEGVMRRFLGDLEPLLYVLSPETFPVCGYKHSFRDCPAVKQLLKPEAGEQFTLIDEQYLRWRYPVAGPQGKEDLGNNYGPERR